jgi:hypothetical protein
MYVRNSYQPVRQSVGILHEEVTDVIFERPIYHETKPFQFYQLEIILKDDRLRVCIVSPRKFSLTNWTLHVDGLPSPVTSSYKLLTVVYGNEADKKSFGIKQQSRTRTPSVRAWLNAKTFCKDLFSSTNTTCLIEVYDFLRFPSPITDHHDITEILLRTGVKHHKTN